MYRLLTPEKGWKQPGQGGQPRFSIVVHSGEDYDAALDVIQQLLGRGTLGSSYIEYP
jgi:hypothetical protein